MDKTLELMTDAAIYRAMLDERPSLVEAIAGLLAHGQAPAEIERIMRSKFGDVQMVRNVGHVANYLTAQR
jgi:hypothetical protein